MLGGRIHDKGKDFFDIASIFLDQILNAFHGLLLLLVLLSLSRRNPFALFFQIVKPFARHRELRVAVGLVVREGAFSAELVIHFFAQIVAHLVNSVEDLLQRVSLNCGLLRTILAYTFILWRSHLEKSDVPKDFSECVVVIIQSAVDYNFVTATYLLPRFLAAISSSSRDLLVSYRGPA